MPAESAKSVSPAAPPTGCPVCGAAMVPVRGDDHCPRCHFTLCVGCEAAPDGYFHETSFGASM